MSISSFELVESLFSKSAITASTPFTLQEASFAQSMLYANHSYNFAPFNSPLMSVDDCIQARLDEWAKRPTELPYGLQLVYRKFYRFVGGIFSKFGMEHYFGFNKVNYYIGLPSDACKLESSIAVIKKRAEETDSSIAEIKEDSDNNLRVPREQLNRNDLPNHKLLADKKLSDKISKSQCNAVLLDDAAANRPLHNYGVMDKFRRFFEFTKKRLWFGASSNAADSAAEKPNSAPASASASSPCSHYARAFMDVARKADEVHFLDTVVSKLRQAEEQHRSCLQDKGFSPATIDLAMRLEAVQGAEGIKGMEEFPFYLDKTMMFRYAFREMITADTPCSEQFEKLKQTYLDAVDYDNRFGFGMSFFG